MKKLTPKQKEIIRLMRDGWILLIGQNDTNGRIFYQVTKGYDKMFFNMTVFSNLLSKGLVDQEQNPPFHYILTNIGHIVKI